MYNKVFCLRVWKNRGIRSATGWDSPFQLEFIHDHVMKNQKHCLGNGSRLIVTCWIPEKQKRCFSVYLIKNLLVTNLTSYRFFFPTSCQNVALQELNIHGVAAKLLVDFTDMNPINANSLTHFFCFVSIRPASIIQSVFCQCVADCVRINQHTFHYLLCIDRHCILDSGDGSCESVNTTLSNPTFISM